ncbi:MAG: DUF4914 family protein [Verrucomicrobiota bacterium]|nr:DUF4914 family protein [Verrucomicrobiota bacterium]
MASTSPTIEPQNFHTSQVEPDWKKFNLPVEAVGILQKAPSIKVASTCEELIDLSCGSPDKDAFDVAYDVPGKGPVVEARVVRVMNGIAANYPEAYMRRRDPDCMLIADDQPTDKTTYQQKYGKPFETLRQESFRWLESQRLMAFAFTAGQHKMGVDAVVICPENAAFFALNLALLQGITPVSDIGENFKPQFVLYVAPPFRHTHFDGRQIVVHNRREGLHEMFAYNLYPGPSAKKGVYGVLIGLGEREGWITAHCSTVQVITPYDNIVAIMHEGASGGGKSEMLEQAHREADGRLMLGKNVLTGEPQYLEIPRTCALKPVTDDMALCHPSIQKNDGKLTVVDAEDAWFVRVNHITQYATDPHLERLTAQPVVPLAFLNIRAVPGGRALIWDHTEDSPGKPCPNPRVIIPRNIIPEIVNEPVTVDIRSIGIRTPPCTKQNPSYGIVGLFHILPPALAWLWRLAAPRGYSNPSITDSEGLSSEGVGSYWPFATGRQVDQANLLLKQFIATPRVRYILCPNQHVGAWAVSFMPQWIAREYLARRGNAKFKPDQILPARCPLLGYALFRLSIEGRAIPEEYLQVELQPEVGTAGYDAGASLLNNFFKTTLKTYLHPDLHPLGRSIIEQCLADASASDYEKLMPSA